MSNKVDDGAAKWVLVSSVCTAALIDYLRGLQRRAEELEQKPSDWMPWNYRETLARLATSAAA